ncbi:MAG: MBL fold metallo-hydrolase [Anaerolineae bacterium]|nr:MBL fold metallo-hydrolase [Anaerolineae bacterium]
MTRPSLQKISPHVYWLPPSEPDRPSLCAVVGSDYTYLLDAGASVAHARAFLDALQAEGVPAPVFVVLTHWHWDHIFGAAEIGQPLIAHVKTKQQMEIQARYAWDDAALDARVASGEEIAFCADNIKLELPEPRQIDIVLPETTFEESLTFDLGGVTIHVQHVGGDHASDSCVIHIAPDNILFLGDCLYDAIYTPQRHLTTEKLFQVLDAVEQFAPEQAIEGHSDEILSRTELTELIAAFRLAGRLVDRIGTDEEAVLAAAKAEVGDALHEDFVDLAQSFIAGKKLTG